MARWLISRLFLMAASFGLVSGCLDGPSQNQDAVVVNEISSNEQEAPTVRVDSGQREQDAIQSGAEGNSQIATNNELEQVQDVPEAPAIEEVLTSNSGPISGTSEPGEAEASREEEISNSEPVLTAQQKIEAVVSEQVGQVNGEIAVIEKYTIENTDLELINELGLSGEEISLLNEFNEME